MRLVILWREFFSVSLTSPSAPVSYYLLISCSPPNQIGLTKFLWFCQGQCVGHFMMASVLSHHPQVLPSSKCLIKVFLQALFLPERNSGKIIKISVLYNLFFSSIVFSSGKTVSFIQQIFFCVLLSCHAILCQTQLGTQQGIRENPGPQGVSVFWRRYALNT